MSCSKNVSRRLYGIEYKLSNSMVHHDEFYAVKMLPEGYNENFL